MRLDKGKERDMRENEWTNLTGFVDFRELPRTYLALSSFSRSPLL